MDIPECISKMLPDAQNISNSLTKKAMGKACYPEDQLLLPSYFYPGFQLGCYHSK